MPRWPVPVLASVALALCPGRALADEGDPKDPPPPPPNVLIVLADDLGCEVLAAYGPLTDQPPTPVIDQLALDGVRFTRCWATPLCTPSRAALQTGRYPLRSGMGEIVGGLFDTDLGPFGLPLEEVTLPEILSLGAPGVWQTACIGKWHLGSEATGGLLSPNMAGYDHFAGTLGNLQSPETYTSWQRVEDGVATDETGYLTTVQVDDALAWIAQATQPWMCVVNLSAPHVPLHAPPPELITQDLSAAPPVGEAPRLYFNAMVEAMDTELGRLLAGLGDAAADTLVIFASDNGTPTSAVAPPVLPQKAKGSFFEGGLHVPLIVRGPGVLSPGSTCDALVDLTDVWATVADVAGVDPALILPETQVIDGRSLMPYLEDPLAPPAKTHVLSELFRPNGVGTGLPVYFGTGPECQEDVGYGGPGALVLSACGEVLVGHQTTEVLLTGAPPSSPVWFAGSYFASPIPVAGGWLVPQPATQVVPFVSDAKGRVSLPKVGGSFGPVSYYLQAATLDPTVPFGVAISNAIKLHWHPQNKKAVRNDRFKLIREYNGGHEFLYDLLNDPGELVDLIAAGPLGVDEDAAYLELAAALDAFVASYQP